MSKQSTRMPTVGFIGQGFIGKNMADDFEDRGYQIVRYALEQPYVENREKIASCDIVFIAVPTPTTPMGFSAEGLMSVLPLVGKGKIAVVKSTILPGTTERLQQEHPHCIVLHSPEFLREKQAKEDTARPARNIVGMPKATKRYRDAAARVLSVLPPAPYAVIMSAREAELVKYAGNAFLAMKVVFMNVVYDIARGVGADFDTVAEAMLADERIGPSHMHVIDSSGHKGAKKGRGAGGHCFPKDLAALRALYATLDNGDAEGQLFLKAIEAKNNRLLCDSKKDLDLLEGIYGKRKVTGWVAKHAS
jgi:nucleotide sugar dehydrogenase